MMEVHVLASGSRGNCTVVASGRTRLLVDAGLSCRELLRRMHDAGETPERLDAILITHEHQDHVAGVAVLARRLGIPVYFSEMTHRAWVRSVTPRKRLTYAEWLAARRAEAERAHAPAFSLPPAAEGEHAVPPVSEACMADPIAGPELPEAVAGAPEAEADPAALPAVEFFRAGERFCVGEIAVFPFTVPHDAADPVGFVFEAEGVRVGIATDLGYMPPNAKQALRGCDLLMLESNHDVEMLRDGPYPWSVKQRVMSRVGHLSNDAAAEFLERTYDGGAMYVVLAHLSESNNHPELARLRAEAALRDRMNLLANKLLLAEQSRPMERICL